MRCKEISIESVGEKLLPTAFAIFAWFMLSPYFTWGRKYLYVAAFLLVVSLFFMWSLNRRVLKKDSFPLVGLISFCVFMFFLSKGASLGWAVIQGMGSGLLLFGYNQFGNRLLDTFKWVFVISLVPGMLLWVWYAVGLPADVWQIGIIDDNVVPNQLKVQSGEHYYEYIGSVALDYMIDSGLPFFRMCGMYDEPGVVGTISGLLLASDRVNMTKKVNILLFAAGMMSFSLAFLLLLTFSLFFYIQWKVILILLLIIFSGIFMLPDSMYEALSEFTVSRLEVKDSGKLAGDNRETGLTKRNFNNWFEGDIPELLFGKQVSSDGGASWKHIFIKTGFVGFMLMAVVLMIPFLSQQKTYSSMVFLIIFLLSVYQRPDVLHFPFFMIFLGGIKNLSGYAEVSK